MRITYTVIVSHCRRNIVRSRLDDHDQFKIGQNQSVSFATIPSNLARTACQKTDYCQAALVNTCTCNQNPIVSK